MDRKGISFFVVGLAVGLVLATAGFSWVLRSQNISGDQGRVRVLKLAHGLDQSHPVHLGMVYMAKRLDELSNGTMKIEIFPNGKLGNEVDCVEQLQRAALEMSKVSTAVLEGFIPEMAVFSMPYIFRDEEHYWTVLKGPVGKELLQIGETRGLHGLCYYDSGSRNFYTVGKPILTPADLAGKKIRVMKSATSMEMVRTLGGAPTPVAWGELYTALQQGQVDGAENNPPSFYTNRHYEVCKYFSMDEHTRIPDILLVSTVCWDSLTARQQQWFQQAADESVEEQRRLWTEMTADALEQVQKYGVEIYYPDKQPFVDKVQPMHARYEGTPVGALMQRIKEVE